MKSKNVLYLLLGTAAGTLLGVLFAPRAGKETRIDVKDWIDERREKGVVAIDELRKSIPAKKDQLTAVLEKGRNAFKRNGKVKAETIEA